MMFSDLLQATSVPGSITGHTGEPDPLNWLLEQLTHRLGPVGFRGGRCRRPGDVGIGTIPAMSSRYWMMATRMSFRGQGR